MRQHLEQFRPEQLSSPRCVPCAFAPSCGGLDQGKSLFNCFDDYCCGNKGCDEVCPNKPDFDERMQEVRSLRFDQLKVIEQTPVALPSYIAHLPHQYSRHFNLASEWASLSLNQLLRTKTGDCLLSARKAIELRQHYKLGESAKLVFRGSDRDRLLEKYWEHRRASELPMQLKALNVALVIGPNYSHFGDVVRTDNLFNRMRQLICLEEMHDAGLNVAPHLNDSVAADWDFWFSYLRTNTTISIVAKEFQTRCRDRREGLRAIERLATLQQRLGRELRPVIIGGPQFVEQIALHFHHFTFIDSRPVQCGIHYHRFIPKGRKGRSELDLHLPNFGPDRLVDSNISTYQQWIDHRAKLAIVAKNSKQRRAG